MCACKCCHRHWSVSRSQPLWIGSDRETSSTTGQKARACESDPLGEGVTAGGSILLIPVVLSRVTQHSEISSSSEDGGCLLYLLLKTTMIHHQIMKLAISGLSAAITGASETYIYWDWQKLSL